MTLELKPLVEINRQALHLLYQELGIVNAVRFLRQFTAGLGDYTKERELFFRDLTLEDILREIKAQDTNSTVSQP